MTVNPTDKFLVNRSGSSYNVEQQNLMAQLQDDDLLLVNRSNKSYKITGAEFKGSLSSPPIIQSVTLTEDDSDGDRFTSQDFITTAVMLDNGNPASTKSIRGWVEGSLTSTIETDVITQATSDSVTYQFEVYNTNSGAGPFEDNKALPVGGTFSEDYTTQTYTPNPGPIPGATAIIWRVIGGGLITNLDVTLVNTGQKPNRAVWTSEDGILWTKQEAIGGEGTFEIPGSHTYVTLQGGPGNQTTEVKTQTKTVNSLTFASDKDLAKLQPGDHIQQEDADYSSTELSELNPSDTVGGSIIEEGLKFTSNISGAWSRSYVGVDEDEKVQFEMTYLSGQGALIGFSLAGSDGSPGPGIIGAVYDSDGTIRFTNNYTGIPASSGYGGGKTVGTTIDNATGVVNFYLEGEFVGTCTLEPNQKLLLYVHANRGDVKANFGKDGFKYPVEGFANFERYEPSGTVASIDVAGNSLTMSKSYGTWGPANAGHYAIGPSTTVDGAKKYLNLDASLNVIGLNDDDSYTRNPGNTVTPKISFPATLDNGEAPDAALPLGTSIQTEFKAENTAGSDEMASNVYTPTPTCVSGLIETDTIIQYDGPGEGAIQDAFELSAGGFVLNKGLDKVLDGEAKDADGKYTSCEGDTNDAVLTWNIGETYVENVKGSVQIYAYDNASNPIRVRLMYQGAVVDTINGGTSSGMWYASTYTGMIDQLLVDRPGRGPEFSMYKINGETIGAAGGTLTFASGKDLAKLQPGDELRQNPHPSPKFSDGLADVAPNGNNNAFDGSTSTWASFSSQGLRSWDWNASEFDLIFDPAGGELQIWCGHRQTQTNWTEGNFEINGIDTGISTPRGISNSQIGGLGGVGNKDLTQWCIDNDITTITRIRETSLSSPAGSIASGTLGAIKLNGEFLIDGDGKLPTGIVGSVDTSAKTVTLATSTNTWGPANASYNAIGPNYVCPPITLDADDPDDVATFDAVKDALDGYKESRRKARLEVLRKLNKSGFSDSEIVVAQCTPIETIRAADEIQERVEKRKPGRTKKTRNRKAD